MRFLSLLLLPAMAFGAILPDTIGLAKRDAVRPAALEDRPLWYEYGLQASEQATYQNGGKIFTVSAYRLQDSTGALGAFQWQRPADSKPSDLGKLAALTASSLTVALGNYLVRFDGWKANKDELDRLLAGLPGVEQGPLPNLPDYLPGAGRLQASERYITGPVGLERFSPAISPATAAFHLGAEAQVASFRVQGSASDLKLALFSYPTPDIARNRLAEIGKIPGAVAKRSGPLVAVVLPPADANAAERLLSQVRYMAAVTMTQRMPTRKDNAVDLFLNLFKLIGILLVFCALSGLAFGGLRSILRRGGADGEGGVVISLHLGER